MLIADDGCVIRVVPRGGRVRRMLLGAHHHPGWYPLTGFEPASRRDLTARFRRPDRRESCQLHHRGRALPVPSGRLVAPSESVPPRGIEPLTRPDRINAAIRGLGAPGAGSATSAPAPGSRILVGRLPSSAIGRGNDPRTCPVRSAGTTLRSTPRHHLVSRSVARHFLLVRPLCRISLPRRELNPERPISRKIGCSSS